MIIIQEIFDGLSAKAKASPQHMLNALDLGTVMAIHRHAISSETVVCLVADWPRRFTIAWS